MFHEDYVDALVLNPLSAPDCPTGLGGLLLRCRWLIAIRIAPKHWMDMKTRKKITTRFQDNRLGFTGPV
jgi:hypothetical protein